MKTLKEIVYEILAEFEAWLNLAYENVKALQKVKA